MSVSNEANQDLQNAMLPDLSGKVPINDEDNTTDNNTFSGAPHQNSQSDEQSEKKKNKQSGTWNINAPCLITAVLYKEAALDSPSFRASMNHLDTQMNYVERWLESFIKSLNKLSAEMDCKFYGKSISRKLLCI